MNRAIRTDGSPASGSMGGFYNIHTSKSLKSKVALIHGEGARTYSSDQVDQTWSKSATNYGATTLRM